MTKAGPSLGRATMFRAADTARKPDPQLARIYYTQMTERGANHLKACCVVAGHLALRLHAAMLRGTLHKAIHPDDNNDQPDGTNRHTPRRTGQNRRNGLLATSLFGDAAAALREHRSAALDEHCWSCAALTES